MFVHVKVYYQKCPTCGQTWSARLQDKTTEPRVGKERFICKCGIAHATGSTEWVHLGVRERHTYFFGSAEIGTMAIATFVPALFAYFVGTNGWRSVLNASAVGFLVGLGIVAVVWAGKMLTVRFSLRRCPHPDPTELHGLAPWEW